MICPGHWPCSGQIRIAAGSYFGKIEKNYNDLQGLQRHLTRSCLHPPLQIYARMDNWWFIVNYSKNKNICPFCKSRLAKFLTKFEVPTKDLMYFFHSLFEMKSESPERTADSNVPFGPSSFLHQSALHFCPEPWHPWPSLPPSSSLIKRRRSSVRPGKLQIGLKQMIAHERQNGSRGWQ